MKVNVLFRKLLISRLDSFQQIKQISVVGILREKFDIKLIKVMLIQKLKDNHEENKRGMYLTGMFLTYNYILYFKLAIEIKCSFRHVRKINISSIVVLTFLSL